MTGSELSAFVVAGVVAIIGPPRSRQSWAESTIPGYIALLADDAGDDRRGAALDRVAGYWDGDSSYIATTMLDAVLESCPGTHGAQLQAVLDLITDYRRARIKQPV